MAIDLAQLKTEITTDPQSFGYSLTDNALTRDLLNQMRASIQMPRGVIPAHEVIDNTLDTDWTALSADEKQRYQTITGAGLINVDTTFVKDAFLKMFGPGTVTRTNLAALLTRDGSRIEELFAKDDVVTTAQVNEALN